LQIFIDVPYRAMNIPNQPPSGQASNDSMLAFQTPWLPDRGRVTTSEDVSRATDIVEQAISTGQPVL